jgi:hypothetical protein
MKATLFDPREPLGGINILQYYFDLGIQGPDFIWAALAVRGANKSIQDWTEVCRQRAAKINGRFDLHRSYPTPSICLRSVFK